MKPGDKVTTTRTYPTNGGFSEITITIEWVVTENKLYNTHEKNGLIWCKTESESIYVPYFRKEQWLNEAELTIIQ